MRKGLPIVKYRDYSPCAVAVQPFCQITLTTTDCGSMMLIVIALMIVTVTLTTILDVRGRSLTYLSQIEIKYL